jgi:AcrR family transcriptional regulator
MHQQMQQARNQTKESQEDTRGRILQVASDLFAAQGFEATTLREITQAAKANLAAVNYHFRSKDELVASAIEAAVRPIVAARMMALDNVLSKTRKPKIDDLAEALVKPLYELSLGQHRNHVLLLLQLSPDPETSRHALVSRHFAPLHQKFVDAFQSLLRDLSRVETAFRYDCARGAILQTLVELAPAREFVTMSVSERKRLRERQQVISALVAFVAAGMTAPAALKVT